MTDNVIELVVKTTDQASQAIKGISKEVDGLGSSMEGLKSIFEGVIAGFTLDKLIENITEAQQATADLERQFSNLGGSVSVSLEDMEAFADGAAKASTLTKASLEEAQANLLNYTSVTGQAFLDARDLVVDLAAKMGGDAAEAATLLGRALQNPVSGIRLLAQVGVTLTQAQKETIASLEQTGGAATAVSFIMDTLKQHLAGAADAATNTLGGALTQLKNSFAEGFTGGGSDLQGLIDAIHQLNAEVNDADFQKGLEGITSAIVDLGTFAIGAVNDVRELGEALAHLFNGADTPLGQLEDKKQALQDLIAQPDLDPTAAQDYIKQLAAVQAQIDKLNASAAAAANSTSNLNQDMGGADFGAKAGHAGAFTNNAKPGLFDALQRPITLGPNAQPITTHDIGGASPIDDIFTQELAATNNDLDNKYNDFLKKQVQRQDLVVNGALSAAKASQENQEDFDDIFAPIKVTAKQMQVPLDDINKEGKEVAQDLTGAFTSFFESGSLSARTFGQDFIKVLDQIFAKALSTDIVGALGLNKLFDQPGGSGSQVGGLFGALFKAFGGSSSSAAGGAVAKDFTDDSLNTAFLLGFAGGGQVSGGPMIVGEDGPEIFTPGVSGSVMNQRQISFNRGGGSSSQPFINSPNYTITATNNDQAGDILRIVTNQNVAFAADLKRQLKRNGYNLK